MNQASIHRIVLLFTGITLTLIGIAYCIDPNLLLARYELSVAGASEDNMYRGAYGGLFVFTGAAIAYGFLKESFRQVSTIIALLFMGGFAFGRVASILALGAPHQQIIGLLIFEIISSAIFVWFLLSQPASQPAQ